MDTTTTTVLVGVDGSASGLAALDWAAQEAHLRRAGLTLIPSEPTGLIMAFVTVPGAGRAFTHRRPKDPFRSPPLGRDDTVSEGA